MQRDASYEDGSFMSFKAVNRENLHLSPPFAHNHQWAGPTRLFLVSNTLGWFVAGTDDTVILSPLSELRTAYKESRKAFQPRVSIPLSIKPISVAFANNHSGLVIAHLNGVISVYDSSSLRNANHTGPLPLMHTFSHSPESIRDLQPNPSDKPEIVAVLRGNISAGTQIEMLNVGVATPGVVSMWESKSPQEAQICMAWSPKGKQISVGNVAGALIQYTPEGVQKSVIRAPPGRQAWPVTSVVWLENTVFYVVYASPGVPSDEQEFSCYAIQTDKVGGTPTYIATPDAAPAFGDRSREGARFFVSLRDWAPMKHILVVADQPSTDVGVIVQHNDRPSLDWATLELEETDRVVLPMDDDGRDTYPVGVDIDLTSTDVVNLTTHGGDETPPAPPSPVLFIYMNTGHLAAYHVLNWKQPSYPGMNASANSQPNTTTTTTPTDAASSMEMAITPNVENPPSVIGATAPLPSASTKPSSPAGMSAPSPFAQSGFGAFANLGSGDGGFRGTSSGGGTFGSTFASKPSTVPLGSSSTFGSSAFGKPSVSTPTPRAFGSTPNSTTVFGQSSFGHSSFGQPPTFGSSPQSQPNSSMAPDGGGFASFATPAATSGFASFAKPTGTSGFGALGGVNALDSALGDGGMDVSPLTPGDEKLAPASTPAGAFDSSSGSTSAFATAAPGLGAFGTSAFASGGSAFANAARGSSVSIAPAFGGQTPVTPSSAASAFGGARAPSPSPFGKSTVFGQSAVHASSPSPPPPSASPAAAPSPSPSTQSSSTFAKGFLGNNTFGSGTSAFSKAVQSPSTLNTSSMPNAFSAPAPPSTMASASGSPTPSGTTTPTFGQSSVLGNKPVFGNTSFGGGFGAIATPAPTLTTPSNTSTSISTTGGFAAFAGGGSFASAFGKVDTSKSAFESSASTSETQKSSTVFGAAKKPGSASQSARSLEEDEDDSERISPIEPGKFDEEVIANREPEKIDNGSLGSLFSSAATSAERLAKTNLKAGFGGAGSLSLDALDQALRLSAPKTPPSEPRTPERPSAPPKADEPESTTPEGSPRPVGPLGTISRSQSASPPPAPAPAALSGVGLGRPTSAPSRLSVPGTSSFSSVPTRSSPLAATPPINRKDVTNSPSPPKAARPSGGMYSKGVEEDDEEAEADKDVEDFLKSRSKSATSAERGKLKSKSPDMLSASKDGGASQSQRTSSVSPPAASLPISDAPKTVQRVKTPPLIGFGFGAGPKKPTTLTAKPLASDKEAGKAAPQHILSASPSPPDVFAAPVPQKLNALGGSPSVSSFQRTQAPRPPVGMSQSSKSTPGPHPTFVQPKSETTPPLENQKPTVNGQVDRIIGIMENELEQLRSIAKQCNHHQNSIIQNKRQGDARFRDVDQWSLGDLKALRRQTNDLEDDTLKLEDESLALRARITELQSLLLKAETSKQEIERLLRAREDKNFAKLLKVRALGPEHLENQTQLRKSIQLANDRVLQLEEQVAAMKRRVHSTKNGGNPLKAPSLDLIARAITNIETAALDKRNKMNALTDRLEVLDISVEDSDESEIHGQSSVSPSPKISKSAAQKIREQTPLDEVLARPTLTPKIKSVSANALNAERAALRLKSALLTIRSRPLLNSSVIPKPVDPAQLEEGLDVSFATIHLPPRAAAPGSEPDPGSATAGKTISFTSVMNASSPFGAGQLGQGAILNFKIPEKVDLPAWDRPTEADEEQSSDSSRRRSSGRGTGRPRHSPSVRLSSHSPASSPEAPRTITANVSASPTPAAPKFDWGFGDLARTQGSVVNPPGFVSLLDYKPAVATSASTAGSSTLTLFNTETLSGAGGGAAVSSNVFARPLPTCSQDQPILKVSSAGPMSVPSMPSPSLSPSPPSFGAGSTFASPEVFSGPINVQSPILHGRGQQARATTTAAQWSFESSSFRNIASSKDLLSRLGPQAEEPENQGSLEALPEEDESEEDEGEDSKQKHLEEELEDALEDGFDEEQEQEVRSHDDGPWEEDDDDDWDGQGGDSDADET